MALIDEVKLRYSTQKLAEWTNPDDVEAEAIDDPWLQDACDDVETEFAIWAGEVYDNSNRKHVVLATRGVEIRLKRGMPKSGEATDRLWEGWKADLLQYAKTAARSKVVPSTDNFQTVTDDRESKRPRFDRSKFRHMRPR